jgi:hypothetical protein
VLRTLSACVLLLALSAAPAAAEWHFTPMVGFTFKGATNVLDVEGAAGKRHKNLGGAVSLFGEGILGAEAIGVWTPALFQGRDAEAVAIDAVDEGRATALMGNVIITTPRRWTEYFLRPYFSGGVGVMSATVTQSDTLPSGPPFDPVRLNAAGYNLGGGAVGFFTDRTGVRVDFRYYSTFRRSPDLISVDPDSSYLRYMTLSVGVVLRRR